MVCSVNFAELSNHQQEVCFIFKIGYAQEIITPPTGVGLAGYFNKRPNQGMYDDLYVKVVMIESNGKKFGFMTFDLCSIAPKLFQELEKEIVAKYGRELHDSLIISATHTHTGPVHPRGSGRRRHPQDHGFHSVLREGMSAARAGGIQLVLKSLQDPGRNPRVDPDEPYGKGDFFPALKT